MRGVMACANVNGRYEIIQNFGGGYEPLDNGFVNNLLKIARSRMGNVQGSFAQRYSQDEGHYVHFYKAPQTATTSAAESEYCISVLETMDPVSFRDENLDNTLSFTFSDIEVVQAIKTNKVDFKRAEESSISAFPLDKKILMAILSGCMSRIINRSERIVISLPDENFEQTMMQVIKTIYSYMPYRLRAFSGYQTYTESFAAAEFTSILFCRNNQKNENTITLNPNDCQVAITKIENDAHLSESTKAYLDYIVNCKPSERRELHDDFWKVLEGNGNLDIFKIKSFREYGEEFAKRKTENRLPHSTSNYGNIKPKEPNQMNQSFLSSQAGKEEEIKMVLGKIYVVLSNQSLSVDDRLSQISEIVQNSNHLIKPTQIGGKTL